MSEFGPIKHADIEFGDLTVLVGPQATGKSILLQLLKLLVDTGYVKEQFGRAGVDWSGNFSAFLDVYFGEGMRSLWETKTMVELNGSSIDLKVMVAKRQSERPESVFFIPAQRVLALRDGWPPAFNYYDSSMPFALREFSEHLRLLMSDFGAEGTLFPVPASLRSEFRELLQAHIFPGFELKIPRV